MKYNNTRRGFRHARRALERAWASISDAATREVISEELEERTAQHAERECERLSHFGSMFSNSHKHIQH